jgi:hypothetical protein
VAVSHHRDEDVGPYTIRGYPLSGMDVIATEIGIREKWHLQVAFLRYQCLVLNFIFLCDGDTT